MWLAIASSGTGDLLGSNCVIENETSNVTADELLSKCASHNNGSDVSFIQFHDCDFGDGLPPVFDAFANLETMDASNTKMTLIQNTTFAEGQSLITLQLFNNSIVRLGGNNFLKLNYLKDLNLASNKINETDEHAFEGLFALLQLDLSMNAIEKLPEGLFYPLHSLQHIRLNDNNIQMIDKDTFDENHVLHTIYLNDNKIFLVDPLAFRSMSSLKTIEISNNPLRNADFLTHAAGLKDITIANTSITSISIPSTAIKVQAHNNKISAVIAVKGASKFSSKFSSKIGSTLLLNLSNNSLSSLGGISSMARVETLILSFNRFTKIDMNEFTNFTILHQLTLNDNDFTDLNATNMKKVLPQLKIINLSLSKWSQAEAKQIVEEFSALGVYVMNNTRLVNPQVGFNYHDTMQPVLPEPQPEKPQSDVETKIVNPDGATTITDQLKTTEDRLNKTQEQLHHHVEKYEKLRDKVRYFVIFAFCLIASLVGYVVYYKNLVYRIQWDRLPVPNWMRTSGHGILDESNEQNVSDRPDERIEPNGQNSVNSNNGRNGGTNAFDRSSVQLIVNVREDESIV